MILSLGIPQHPTPNTQSLILGIETSCDETAAAVVDSVRTIRSNVVLSQIEDHTPFGGVVPEIAARAHIRHIDGIIQEALSRANVTFQDIDAIAATCGPGLIGGVIVGAMTAKALASALDKPFIAVNHLEGHALTARLTHNVQFPYLLLLVSGGHCQFFAVRGIGDYVKLGGTRDDALGEAFDKTAKLLGLGFPGGPAVERIAREGNPNAYKFTVPMKGREGCDFSFSGLKTAVREAVQETGSVRQLSAQQKADLCASFQKVALDSVLDRARNAVLAFSSLCGNGSFVVAGGVAANQYLRSRLSALAEESSMPLVVPPGALCTDNAAMIAWAGLERFRLGQRDGMDTEPKARWPLAS